MNEKEIFSFVYSLTNSSIFLTFATYRGVEQLVARWAHNPKVVSSSLAPATKEAPKKKGAFFIYIGL